MKNIELMKVLAIFILLIAGMNHCTDDNDSGKVLAVTVLEAVRDGDNNNTMTISLKDDATLQLTPYILPQNATNKNVSYSNLHPEILVVSESGLITPKSVGTDTLTVSAMDGSGVKTSYLVRIIDHMVKATAINVTAEGSNMTLKVGGEPFNLVATVTLSPADTWDKSVAYSSKDESIATVSEDGMVTPVAIGNTVITVKTLDGSDLTRECNVTVLDKAPVNLDRSKWTGKTAAEIEGTAGGFHYTPETVTWIPDRIAKDGVSNALLTGMPSHLFDDNAATFLSMLKPGKSGYNTGPGAGWNANDPATKQLMTYLGTADKASASVDASAVNYFVVDMQEAQPFSFVRWTHRNNSRNLQVWAFDIHGSNDGTSWSEPLNGSATIALDGETGEKTLWITEEQEQFNYRYVKVVVKEFNTATSMNVQIGDFGLGYLN